MSGLGLILSGGGARGAYEVGVLEYIFNEFGDATGKPPSVDLISGTSVGAVNGAFVASMLLSLSQLALAMQFTEPQRVLCKTSPRRDTAIGERSRAQKVKGRPSSSGRP